MRKYLLAIMALVMMGCAIRGGLYQSDAGVACSKVAGPRPWSYCMEQAQGGSTDVLYYLHGAGGSERTWADQRNYTQALRNRWRAGGGPVPAVVAVSFGPQWLLAESNPSKDSGLFDVFVRQIVPSVEEKLGNPQGRRFLLGESMGGFNGSQLILKKGDLFDRAALLCPGIPAASPFEPEAFERFLARNNASRDGVRALVGIVNRFYPDAESWRSGDPLTVARQRLNSKTPKLYVSCGRQDEFGFFEGAAAFAELAQTRGVKTEWHPLDGGHCVVDAASVADFFTR